MSELIIELVPTKGQRYTYVGNAGLPKERSEIMASQKVTASLQDDKGTWTVRGRVYDPSTGKMRNRARSTGFKVKDNTKRKAKDMMQEILAQWQAEAEGVTLTEGQPFSVYVQRWLSRKKELRIKANTLKSYEDYNKVHISPTLGSIPVMQITTKDLEDFFSHFLETHTVNSARKVNCVINGAFREAIRDGAVQSNLADNNHLEFPKAEKYDGGAYYTEKEVASLLEAAKEAGEPIRTAIVLGVCYGLRRSEVCGLRWKDIDFENETLTVANTVVSNGELWIEAEDTKTNSSFRTLYLCKMTIPYLKALKKSQETAGIELDKVCVFPNGERVRPDYITLKAKKVMQKAGLRVIRFHDLRHTAATLLAPHITQQQLKAFLGHFDKSVTYGIYAHVMDKERKATAEVMNTILKNAGVLF